MSIYFAKLLPNHRNQKQIVLLNLLVLLLCFNINIAYSNSYSASGLIVVNATDSRFRLPSSGTGTDGPNNTSASYTDSVKYTDFYGNEHSASIDSSANNNHLTAYASVKYTGNTDALFNYPLYNYVNIAATSDSGLTDTITIESETLPTGSPVDVLFTVLLKAYGSNDGDMTYINGAYLSMQAESFYTNVANTSGYVANRNGYFTNEVYTTFNVGDIIPFTLNLSTTVGISPNYSYDKGKAVSDVSHTGFLDITILTQDAYYTSESNTVYTSPIPEPSTFLLLGAGISGLALYRRKARK